MTSISVTTSSTSRRSSASADTQLAGTAVHALWTGAADGDLRTIGSGPFPAGVPGDLVLRRARQVHDAGVLVVDSPVPDGAEPWVPGPEDAPPEGDAVVASGAGFALAVLTADCASVALASPEGVHGAVHVGWRGLGAGVLVRTIDTMRALGANTVVAGLGPCIGPCCYEFSGPISTRWPRRVVRTSRAERPGESLARPAGRGAWSAVTLRSFVGGGLRHVHHVHAGILLAPRSG